MKDPTPDERAESITECRHDVWDVREAAIDHIRAAETAAALREREACARVVDTYGEHTDDLVIGKIARAIAKHLAAAIRGQKKTT